ncbi:Crp/Fnr family transcriptional regulator [Methylobacterium nodulans]|uniref:Transcriptional regulator, Crp/Fnr family n=1 Tax=Methylobacterium nodulans (strain LMG 21967 / CNCM I-2342 / ORS 2060) TaxID=460265 RepID=B8IPD8_METNO|nr:Crp/Fnr family transcriptional regulator [Methylobacterium nodulans]ACL62230.1 transcriptional regulator, Crp/Fnr family [Methylobacterium nodulans ORS 2060]
MNPLTRKLEHFVRLSSEDKAALDRLASEQLRGFGPHANIIHEGQPPKVMRLMLSGWACRYKLLEDGGRQIVGLFLPGDFCDVSVFILREMDHSIAAMTDVTLAQISAETFNEIAFAQPRIMYALWWESLVREAIQREWIVSLGRRDTDERIAHLFCELFIRLRCVGLTSGVSIELPMTQSDLSDIVGVSAVHVNRTLQTLRANGLVILKGKTLTIPNLNALMDAAQFNTNYLHLDHEGAHLDASEG